MTIHANFGGREQAERIFEALTRIRGLLSPEHVEGLSLRESITSQTKAVDVGEASPEMLSHVPTGVLRVSIEFEIYDRNRDGLKYLDLSDGAEG